MPRSLENDDAHSLKPSDADSEKGGNHEPVSDQAESFLVEWSGPLDPGNPANLPLWRKWAFTMSISLLSTTTTFSSSVVSPANGALGRRFGISDEVAILATTTYLLGFVFGPTIFGPLSELYGRKRPLLLGFAVFAILQIPPAVATNIQTIMVCRFFQGLAGSSAPSITGGALADVWTAEQRGYALPAFSASLFVGPILGPIIGSFIVESRLGWRWVFWVTGIMALTFGSLAVIAIPETFAPVLLTRRARSLRKETGNVLYWAAREKQKVAARDILTRHIVRPYKMLFLEPILLLITVYLGFVFGVIYLIFQAFPISYAGDRGFGPSVATLPFLAVLVGALTASLLVARTTKTKLAPNFAEGRLQETRLILMAAGGCSLTIGLFWFAWTSFPSISPWPQIVSGVPIGFGIMLITLQGMNYVIDCYTKYANSALAANTSVRYLASAGFPLFANAMYHNLGVQWASTLLAFIALALVPVPVLFYKFGAKIRQKSGFAVD